MAFPEPAKQKENYRRRKRKDPVRSHSQSDKFSQFRSRASWSERPWHKLISSSLGEETGNNGEDDK